MSAPLITASPTKGIKVDAAVVAKKFRQEIKDKVVELKNEGTGKFKLKRTEQL